ncbi:MAG TPA: hypothetical protein VJ249_08660 [Candidatus Bathyarchaeia archaeon]|nr:hypothetical protein [Candidatus Bathyarchaeia archaeon]
MRKSLWIALTAVFAALHAVLYFVTPPVLWRNWAIYLEPIEGILLGPAAGFFAALLGGLVGRTIKPTDPTMFIFGIIAEPVGVMVCGLLARGEWKVALPIYATSLAAYFAHPFGRWFPLWTIADTLLALALIYPVARIGKWVSEPDIKKLAVSLVLISFIGVAADALIRIFLLIPGGLHVLFTTEPEIVYSIFVAGALDSFIEDALVVAVSFFVGVPLLLALQKIPGFKYPMT